MTTGIQRAARQRTGKRTHAHGGGGRRMRGGAQRKARGIQMRGASARKGRRGKRQSGIQGLISQVTSKLSPQRKGGGQGRGRSRKGMLGALAGMGAAALAGRRLLQGRGRGGQQQPGAQA